MRKWSFFLFVAFLIGVIGCGGGGTGTPTGPTTTTTTTGTRAGFGVNIPNTAGLLDTYFEPTQGRQNISYFAVIDDLYYEDVNGFTTSNENTQTIAPITLGLSSPSQNPLNDPLDVTVPDPGFPATSREFFSAFLFINDFYNSVATTPIPGYEISLNNAIQASVFQGRITAIQLYLNDGEFDETQTPPAFNQTEFMAENVNPSSGLIQGFLSDYLSIDISGVAKKPVMSNGQTAGRVFISGDDFALARTTPTSAGAYFEVLTPFGVYPGQCYETGANSQGLPSKTYQLTQPNILSLTNAGVVTSLEGLWYDWTDRISATDSTLMVTFPATGDGSVQEFIIAEHNAGFSNSFPNLYFGSVDLKTGLFNAYPIADMEPGSTAGMISGSLKNYVDGSGNQIAKTGFWWRLVHGGTFKITNGSAVGIATSGRFVTYRV